MAAESHWGWLANLLSINLFDQRVVIRQWGGSTSVNMLILCSSNLDRGLSFAIIYVCVSISVCAVDVRSVQLGSLRSFFFGRLPGRLYATKWTWQALHRGLLVWSIHWLCGLLQRDIHCHHLVEAIPLAGTLTFSIRT